MKDRECLLLGWLLACSSFCFPLCCLWVGVKLSRHCGEGLGLDLVILEVSSDRNE